MTRLRAWLGRVGGRDAVERRQAYILQAFLVALGVVFLVAGLNTQLRELPPGTERPFPTNVVAAVVVAGLIAVLRRGHFRLVAGLVVGLLVATFGAAMALSDPVHGAGYLVLLMLPIVVAGLLLPRVALVLTAVGAYLAGQAGVAYHPIETTTALAPSMGNFLFAILLIAFAVDQFGGTVRTALRQSLEHEQALEAGRQMLATRTQELQTAVESLSAEIAERQRLEIERAELREQMLTGQRLESVGRLAGGVAHDFNNLLTAIRGYADLASSRSGSSDEIRSDLDGVRHATDQAASLTRQLLAFSRNQELRPSVVDLNQVLAGVEPLLRRLLGEHIRIVVRPAEGLWPVLVDPGQMESIVVNLAVNARDAMEQGGTLTIETGNVELDNDYARAHDEVVPGPYAMVAVTDTGIGMGPETISHIFEPFFTTKAVGKGTGLGLASVYGTVRQSGGHIWVYSEPGRGTTFKLYLPRSAQAAPVAESAAPEREPRTGHEIVLVAEDEAYVREMIVMALERRGYAVLAVGSGEEALAVIERADARIGVLLTDAVMPGMGGLELLERARAVAPELRAILMSGYTAQAMDQRPLPDDVAFLEKPFTLTRLDEAIGEILAR